MQTRIVLSCLLPALALSASCKSRPSRSGTQIKSADEYPVQPMMTTPELHKWLKERVIAQAAKATVDDGSNPAEDIWDYYIDPTAAKRMRGIELRNHRDMFGVPLSALRLPAGSPIPDPCQEIDKLEVNGKPACNSMDNLMRYMWEPKAKGKTYTNSKDWFVNIIPQFNGSKQPALQRFLHEGDIIVYFHPEDRSDDPEVVTQWRTSHAATILKRESDGAVMTADTPAGYAKPFNGADDTPFHVYRFIPRDFQDWKVADEYGRQVARWATLAFDKFPFQGDYGVMADGIRQESEIDKFADNYIKSANSASRDAGFLPPMYCAWFTWTNLNLSWMRPMSPAGLGDTRYNELKGKEFTNLRGGHSYAGGNFDSGYAIPAELQNRFSKRNNFAVMPMTAPELILGFLDRMVGKTSNAKTPLEFIAMAKVKAGILAQFAQSSAVSTFQVEDRTGVTTAAGTPTATEYNSKVQATFLTFAKTFGDLADAVATGAIDVAGANAKIQESFMKVTKEEWTTNRDIARKWIPPYGFMHHAEYGYETYNVQEKGHPVLAYVGTVFHEKYLRRKGEAAGSKKLIPIDATPEEAEDKKLDEEIYTRLGCSVSSDGNGWKALLSHLNPAAGPTLCGTAVSGLVKMTPAEFFAMTVMSTDWETKSPPTERDAYVRNTFGLDPVMMRRLLASYWNDPTVHFKPAIYQGDASTVDSAVTNLRILLNGQKMTLNATPAALSKYDTEGHPRRQRIMPCVAFGTSESRTCRNIRNADTFLDQ